MLKLVLSKYKWNKLKDDLRIAPITDKSIWYTSGSAASSPTSSATPTTTSPGQSRSPLPSGTPTDWLL
jgi:hypothetical protein